MFHFFQKMKVTIALFGLLACAYAMPAPQELPAGVSAAECPNFPYCGATPEQYALIPGAASHNDAVEAIKAAQFALSQPILPEVPGLAEHQAAEARVLADQGLNPGIIVHSGNEARVHQAEQSLIALQQV